MDKVINKQILYNLIESTQKRLEKNETSNKILYFVEKIKISVLENQSQHYKRNSPVKSSKILKKTV